MTQLHITLRGAAGSGKTSIVEIIREALYMGTVSLPHEQRKRLLEGGITFEEEATPVCPRSVSRIGGGKKSQKIS